MLRINRLPILSLALAMLLAGCSSPPKQLSDLPRTPLASAEQILQNADRRSGAEAHLLRLHAAQAASNAGQHEQTKAILQQIPQSELPVDQQIRFSELQATSALGLNNPAMALAALRHSSMAQIGSIPMDEQLAIQQLRARAFELTGDSLSAARERVFIHNLLPVAQQQANLNAIWNDISQLSSAKLQQAHAAANGEMRGWLELALIDSQLGNIDLQAREIKQWQSNNPGHPAANALPDSLNQLLTLHASRPKHIALLLPFEGPLASAAQALRDGFLAAQYQAYGEGIDQPRISLYDSTAYNNLQDFYAQAVADGVEWVIGPLERDQVSALAALPSLPLPTLALNYTEAPIAADSSLFQFGLAPEDEARSAALQAWAEGHRSMAALTAQTDWGNRAYQAFKETWEGLGGILIGREMIDQPAEMAGQIGQLLQIRQSEQRMQRMQRLLGNSLMVQPTPRQDLDALFLAATPQQARQLMPTLAFQYAGDLPVFSTSHGYQVNPLNNENADLDGILVAEIPWLLSRNDSLYQPVTQNWPQASGALGRLYAMGIDAQRIFSRLPQLQQYPDTRVNGATGQLSLSTDGRISRQLSWGVMEAGELSPTSLALQVQ